MFKALRSLLAEFSGESERRPTGEDEQRLAAAALLHHVIAVDGSIEESERSRLLDLLKQQYGLDDDGAGALFEEAALADQESVDLYRFTSLLKERLDEPGRENIIAMMWDLVYRDGQLHEFEDNVIWRVADLLGISNRDRIRLKQSVRGGAATES